MISFGEFRELDEGRIAKYIGDTVKGVLRRKVINPIKNVPIHFKNRLKRKMNTFTTSVNRLPGVNLPFHKLHLPHDTSFSGRGRMKAGGLKPGEYRKGWFGKAKKKWYGKPNTSGQVSNPTTGNVHVNPSSAPATPKKRTLPVKKPGQTQPRKIRKPKKPGTTGTTGTTHNPVQHLVANPYHRIRTHHP